MVTLYTNGTDTLYMEKGPGEKRNVTLYAENQTYGVALPVFRCSDNYLQSIFGSNNISCRKTLQMSADDSELIIETILEDDFNNYKPHGVIFADFKNEFQGYTTSMTIGAEYHFWKRDEYNNYYDVILDRNQYTYTFSPIEYLRALVLVEVSDEEMQEVLIDQIYM